MEHLYETVEGKCKLAKDWWQEKQAYWNDVRKVWDELFAQKQTVQIETKIDGQILFMKLFALEDEMLKDGYNSTASTERIKETINTYLKNEVKLSSN